MNYCSVETCGLWVKGKHQLQDKRERKENKIKVYGFYPGSARRVSYVFGFEKSFRVQCRVNLVHGEGNDATLAHMIPPAEREMHTHIQTYEVYARH